MIEKSFKIYLFGFTLGVIICFLLVLSFPSIYHAFLALLIKKAKMQEDALGSLTLAISLNNVLASLMCAYGGYITSKIFLQFNTPHSRFAWNLRFLDRKVAWLSSEKIKHYLALYTFPVTILFLNGFVLGAFFILYTEDLGGYFNNLFPHAFFEIPGILFSGSIGMSIAEGSVFSDLEFKQSLDMRARKELIRYAIVVELLIIGALLEALPA